MGKLKIVDENYNFHEDLGDKCQRLLNALELGM